MVNTTESTHGTCNICHGTGWQLYTATVDDYGYPAEVDFARRCPKCSGQWRSDDRTGTPDEYRDAGIDRFDFTAYSADASGIAKIAGSMFRQWREWERFGKGLYLWSQTPGSGKTFLACCIAKSVMVKYDLQMRFVTAPDYINAVAESYKRERGAYDPSEIYRTCPLLVFDDIGAQVDKEWQRQEIFRLVNQRLSAGVVTIYTSNMPVEKLNIDERAKDRIIKSSVALRMPEESIRRKLASSEQEQFLRKIRETA